MKKSAVLTSLVLSSSACLGGLLLATGCDDGATEEEKPEEGNSTDPAIAVLTRVCGPDTCQSYLNAYSSLDDLRDEGTVDRSQGLELTYSQGKVYDGSVYVFSREEPEITRYTVEDDLSIVERETLSLANTGTVVFCQICNVFAGPELAYHIDAITGGVVVAWNPKTMELLETSDVPDSVMTRMEGASAELIFPSAVDGRAFYNASWTDWDGLHQYEKAAVVAFDTDSPTPDLTVIEDDRCGGTYAMSPFPDEEGNVYAMGDWQGGYFDVGTLTERPPACLLRIKPGADEFDPDYYVNLLEVTGARAIRNAFPMSGGRILLNILPSDAPAVSEGAFEEDPWAYYNLEGFTFAIYDVESEEVILVSDLEPAAAGNSTPLSMDGRNFIQIYPNGRDEAAHMYEIKADGSAEKVVEAGSAGDFSMIGRLR